MKLIRKLADYKLIYMTANELRTKYLKFFESKGHTIIPSASLIPENDPSVLFTTAGMHPLVPYLLGEKHPGGNRVVNVQKCVRTSDIEDVGDNRHLTFFEMMGNWSFGDYFKKEAIEWSFEFLTSKNSGLGLDPNRLYVTVFKGEGEIPRDDDSIKFWKETFKLAEIKAAVAGYDEIVDENTRIIPLGVADNFWIAGPTGPCGGDTEMFYDTRPEEGKIFGKFSDLIDSGRIIEIWNNVFMEFEKKEDGTIDKLKQHNVDTGMGVERTLAVLNGKANVFETELFQSLFEKISELSGKEYKDYKKEFKIVADHIKASTFMIADGVTPLNVGRGYVLRRLIRRAIRYAHSIGLKEGGFSWGLSAEVIRMYSDFYGDLKLRENDIRAILFEEEAKFRKTLEQGLKVLEGKKRITGEEAFNLFQTYGFPIELTREFIEGIDYKMTINEAAKFSDDFESEFKKHQDLSRTASAGMFKGGLADSGEETTKLHTAAHLMLAGLRKVLGEHVVQKGSNITAERLRFDFSHGEKMTDEQKKAVEDYVNAAIAADAEIKKAEMSPDEAKKSGAMGAFEAKYGEKVTVYAIEKNGVVFSHEICGGPHAERTGALGRFKIQKEEASSAGVRRIKAILE